MKDRSFKTIPKSFPSNLLKKAYSLEEMGQKELAWKYNDVIKVIEFLTENNYIILGGDVYAVNQNKFESTYDNWYLDENTLKESDEMELVHKSRQQSIDYIKKYTLRNGRRFYYVVVWKQFQ